MHDDACANLYRCIIDGYVCLLLNLCVFVCQKIKKLVNLRRECNFFRYSLAQFESLCVFLSLVVKYLKSVIVTCH